MKVLQKHQGQFSNMHNVVFAFLVILEVQVQVPFLIGILLLSEACGFRSGSLTD